MNASAPSTGGIAATTLSQRLPAQRSSDAFEAYASVHQLGIALQRASEAPSQRITPAGAAQRSPEPRSHRYRSRPAAARGNPYIVRPTFQGRAIALTQARHDWPARLPALATPAGAAPDLIHGRNGRLVDHDPQSFIAALQDLLAGDWEAASQAAWETAQRNDVETAARGFEAALHAALQR